MISTKNRIESILVDAINLAANKIYFSYELEGQRSLVGVDPEKGELLKFVADKVELTRLRYKIRSIGSDGKIIDTKYSDFTDFSKLINFSAGIDLLFPCENYSSAPENIKLGVIKKIYLKYLEEIWSCTNLNNLRLDYYSTLIKSMSKECSNCPLASYLYTYLKTHIEFIGALVDGLGLDDALARLEGTFTSRSRFDLDDSASESAYFCVKAKVYSHFDCRSTAACFFKKATTISNIIEKLYLDIGAYTYFNSDQVNSEKESRLDVGVSQDVLLSSSGNKKTFLISLDPKFLKIYGPTLAYYAMHFHEYDFKLCVCSASSSQSLKAAKEFSGYVKSLAEFATHNKRILNITIESVVVPGWVENIKTYYACYRFYAVEKTLNQYDAVYTLDADLSFRENPKAFVDSLDSNNIGLAIGSAKKILVGESPWRMVGAGSVYFESNDDTYRFLDNLNSYIQLGLKEPVSWCLDQNALAYALEYYEGDYVQLDGRPVYQDKIRSNYERNIIKELI